ncbi:hypothetical protein TNCV_2045041 [Trichonephila clavipes]|nr:hypothetical protein TNCV_2045041 [Trichonephila clavipes]
MNRSFIENLFIKDSEYNSVLITKQKYESIIEDLRRIKVSKKKDNTSRLSNDSKNDDPKRNEISRKLGHSCISVFFLSFPGENDSRGHIKLARCLYAEAWFQLQGGNEVLPSILPLPTNIRDSHQLTTFYEGNKETL